MSIPLAVCGTGKRFPAMKPVTFQEFLKAINFRDLDGKQSFYNEGIWTDAGATEGRAYWRGERILGVAVELGSVYKTEYFVPVD